jgi:hypothetical protein
MEICKYSYVLSQYMFGNKKAYNQRWIVVCQGSEEGQGGCQAIELLHTPFVTPINLAELSPHAHMFRVGQNRIYTPYMTVRIN